MPALLQPKTIEKYIPYLLCWSLIVFLLNNLPEDNIFSTFYSGFLSRNSTGGRFDITEPATPPATGALKLKLLTFE